MIIETERLLIRPFIMDDVFDMHDLFILSDVMQPVGMAPAFKKIEESRERISRWIKKGIHHAIVLKGTDKVIGYIVIKPDSEDDCKDTRELGFAINPKYQHHAYMTETVKAVTEYLRVEGIRFVWACCFKDNLSSKNLIERCGFEFQNSGEYFVETEQHTYQSLEFRMDLQINGNI
ncbi:GNAT family N-acetyltransferase [Anaerosacchariphilus polymeriproducens]|uniref:N-acetyltransferase n=1 Tax=Anaerosacchariphilus polymeriproducens TaxID=1812858 RepID=A0A371AYF8_9FIRM|nr:GNAT family N-acetyltransferase [Anaerosacchariphilus polymeriproducens]RDU24593.1 N-acetyltransferase [Anaerosacchariphilus polymeriproducens]